ncbi:hypothetical protein CEXT_118461 [Caerostris extrusa]|uniref:Uncharacterized protein n=1 Tax=Caerostris extrusa TaxID=172846 RepID=A0AAV4UG12_CAEEX|nr:hypothetical protein CEXT_118461 [Caerostris extrusa]
MTQDSLPLSVIGIDISHLTSGRRMARSPALGHLSPSGRSRRRCSYKCHSKCTEIDAANRVTDIYQALTVLDLQVHLKEIFLFYVPLLQKKKIYGLLR